MDSPFLKDASEGASATEAGREFHNGIVRGKKLNLNESEDVEYCLSFLEWAALVLVVDGVRYLAAGIWAERFPVRVPQSPFVVALSKSHIHSF